MIRLHFHTPYIFDVMQSANRKSVEVMQIFWCLVVTPQTQGLCEQIGQDSNQAVEN